MDPLSGNVLVLSDLEQGNGKWRNISSIIRFTFRALLRTVEQQDTRIRNLEAALAAKASNTDVGVVCRLVCNHVHSFSPGLTCMRLYHSWNGWQPSFPQPSTWTTRSQRCTAGSAMRCHKPTSPLLWSAIAPLARLRSPTVAIFRGSSPQSKPSSNRTGYSWRN